MTNERKSDNAPVTSDYTGRAEMSEAIKSIYHYQSATVSGMSASTYPRSDHTESVTNALCHAHWSIFE